MSSAGMGTSRVVIMKCIEKENAIHDYGTMEQYRSSTPGYFKIIGDDVWFIRTDFGTVNLLCKHCVQVSWSLWEADGWMLDPYSRTASKIVTLSWKDKLKRLLKWN